MIGDHHVRGELWKRMGAVYRGSYFKRFQDRVEKEGTAITSANLCAQYESGVGVALRRYTCRCLGAKLTMEFHKDEE